MNHTSFPSAAKAISDVRQGRGLYFDDSALGDLDRETLLHELAPWVRSRRGWVYLAANPSWPGLFKIGCTRKGIPARMASLNRIGVVTEWTCASSWVVFDAHGLEAMCHLACKPWQVSSEMFRAQIDELSRVIQNTIETDAANLIKGLKAIAPAYALNELLQKSHHV